MRHQIGVIGLLILGLLSVAQAEAAEISTGPLRVNPGDDIVCIAANAGAANVANVVLTIWFRRADGTSNGNLPTTCGTLTPGETCQRTGSGVLNDSAVFCEVTYPGGRIRGTLCNVSLGLCSNAD